MDRRWGRLGVQTSSVVAIFSSALSSATRQRKHPSPPPSSTAECLEPRSPEVQGSRCPANGPYYLPSTSSTFSFPERRYHVGDDYNRNPAAFCLCQRLITHQNTQGIRLSGCQAAVGACALQRVTSASPTTLSPENLSWSVDALAVFGKRDVISECES